MKKCLFTAILTGLALVSQAAWMTQNGVTAYTNQANWEAAVAANNRIVQTLETTAGNVALADEVATPPGENEHIGNTLTFDKANTGFDVSIELKATQATNFTFNDNEGHAIFRSNALSVGDVNNDENDNFLFTILGGSTVNAAGFSILDNNFGGDEELRVRIGDTVLASFDTDSLTGGTGSSLFLGVVSTTAFDELWFDESTDGDDMAVSNINIDAVPEPSTLIMLAGAGILLHTRRRVSPARAVLV